MRSRKSLLVTLAAMALVLGACSTDSPTEPTRQPAPPPGSGSPSSAWNISVTASPSDILIDGTNSVTTTISVFVRAVTDNQPPPDGATVVLSTSLGTFGVADGGTASSVAVTLTGGQAATVLTLPGTADATAVVQAQLEGSVGQTAITLTIPPEPPPPPPPPPFFIDSITPNAGSANGSRVRINGSGFDEPIRVLFGGSPAQIVSITSTTLVVDTPPVTLEVNETLTVNVSVTINLNDTDPDDTQQTDNLPNAFTYFSNVIPVPDIFTVTPTSGPNEGGTRVTIRGEGFSNEVQVFFGRPTTLVEAPVQSVSANRIEVTTPSATGVNSSNRNSIVDVSVINLDSGFEDILTSAFQYGNPDGVNIQITAVTPVGGLYTGGNQVTIFGNGFDDPVSVGLGSVDAPDIRSVSGTEIVVIAPAVGNLITGCQDLQGPVSVTNIETGETASALQYTFQVIEPFVAGITPSTSPPGGGGGATISGGGFVDPIRVLFGGVAASGVTVNSTSSISVTIPPFNGSFPTEPCDDNGDGTDGVRELPAEVDITILNVQTECEDTLTGAFAYVPPTTCVGDLGAPSAAFSASTSGLTVFVNNLSTGSGNSYLWDFGDGTTSAAEEPGSHTYAAAGTYTVTLTATNAAGSSTATQSVTVM